MIRYKLILLTLFCLVILSLPGCATKPTVFSDFDARHDFSKDHKFTWVQDPPLLRAGDYILSALAEKRMTDAIKNEFIIKGYEFVEDKDQADFSVVYTMGARDKIEITEHSSEYYRHFSDWGWGAYYFPYFVHFPYDSDWRYRDEYSAYTLGEIALDIFDSKTKKPIWHTKASKRLTRKELNSNANNAAEIAMNLLQHFPWRGCHVEPSEQCRPFDADF